MLYRQYGKTNETVSALGFGCMRLPVIDGDPARIDEEKAMAMLRHAIDAGVNYVDTAYPYHGSGFSQGGSSEPFVAKALRDGYRGRIMLATKLPSWLIKTRADMDRYLNEQLKRLQTDTIDFYLVHSLNKNVWPVLKAAGIDRFLDRALQDGRIRHAGFSFHDRLGLFKEIVDYYDWSFCQTQYNYLDEHYQAGREGLQYAAAKGLGVAIMEPLRGGNLVNLPGEARALLDRAGIQKTAAELALRWVWNHPAVSVVLSGMTTLAQVAENLRTAAAAVPNSLTAAEMAAVDQIRQIFNAKIQVNCTACSYCMPCPAAINIPGYFAVYNDYHVFDGAPAIKQRYQFLTRMAAPASNCIACGKCESHCPQGIAIRQELKQVAALFE